MSHLYQEPNAYRRRLTIPFSGLHTRAAAHARSAAPESGAVLDIGCGPGTLALRIARSRPDLRVSGVDPSAAMVDYAAKAASRRGFAGRVDFAVGQAARMPFEPGSFDVVVSTMSFHHWAALPDVVRELRRVVRPGGRIFVYDMRAAYYDGLRSAVEAVAPEWTFRRKFLWLRVFPSLMFGCAEISVPS
ncbi:class I SAM-dependent methyltransferase [Amycolatopsis sp. CA-230715]|uniref:class I SAM-dependent methyltransferase n=1 Tax=Amycolatopsis sp. CA-230715 TaxID=2745196 RepID=UPI001C01B084|nr:class I SAM-dependent methyltransferase [Amycolatopsis sp. CA-230715]QWF82453.1 Ubiquinone/menaquinone biosynthesis C-methyltransferase UbiE [Amycolatopsis sp. CA-230715]